MIDRGVASGAVLFLLLVVSSAGCASTGAVPRPFPMPEAAAPSPDSPSAIPADSSSHGLTSGFALTGTALSLRGAPYRDGGSTPLGFDCSGFVQYVYAQNGVEVPRGVREQFGTGLTIDRTELEAGDLVFFTTVAPGASHVGIALGEDQFVHAPSSSGVVRVEYLSAPYWASRYVGAKRIGQRRR